MTIGESIASLILHEGFTDHSLPNNVGSLLEHVKRSATDFHRINPDHTCNCQGLPSL